MNDFNSFYLVEINIFITIRIELHSFLHFFHSFLNILGQIKMLKPRTRTVLSTAMSVELTLSRSASFVSSIIDPSAFFVHFFNSFLLIWKILVRDDLRTSQIETLNSQGHRGRVVLTNSSPLAQKAKESLKSSSVKVKLNKSILLIFGLSTYGLGCPNLPGCKFNSFMKIFHFSMWLVCISIDTSIKIFVKRSFEFFLCVTQTFDLSTDRSVKPWTIRCSYVRVSRGQSVTWPVLKTVQNEIGWKVHLIH